MRVISWSELEPNQMQDARLKLDISEEELQGDSNRLVRFAVEDELPGVTTCVDGQNVVGPSNSGVVGMISVESWREGEQQDVIYLVNFRFVDDQLDYVAIRLLLSWIESELETPKSKNYPAPNSYSDSKIYLATNSSSNTPEITRVLEEQGFSVAFTQSRMRMSTDEISSQISEAIKVDKSSSHTSQVANIDQVSLNPHEANEIGNLVLREANSSELGYLWDLNELAYEGREFTSKGTEEDRQEFIATHANSIVTVAQIGDKVVGYVSSSIDGHTAEVLEVTVHPQFQRKGIAMRVLLENLSCLAQRGAKDFWLNTNGENVSGAKTLYSKVGFNEVETHLKLRKLLS